MDTAKGVDIGERLEYPTETITHQLLTVASTELHTQNFNKFLGIRNVLDEVDIVLIFVPLKKRKRIASHGEEGSSCGQGMLCVSVGWKIN